MMGRAFWLFVPAYWIFQAATLGISDDEAYYWVLSRSPALGYVYHPPLVAWLIATSEVVVGWLPLSRELIVRLPGLMLMIGIVALARSWLKRVRPHEESDSNTLSWTLVPGLAAMAWMMVPDQPLLFGWMLAFTACSRIIESDEPKGFDLGILALGAAIGMLSKFSAVLYCGSAAACILVFSREKARPLAALLLGAGLGAAPSLIWNAHNEWAAFVYQFQARHSGSGWNGRRYLLFWLTQAIFAGPLLFTGFRLLLRAARSPLRIPRGEWNLIFWFLPSAIFLVQPAFSEFKPHWPIVCWLPLALWSAWRLPSGSARGFLTSAQPLFVSGLLLTTLVLTQLPAVSMVASWSRGTPSPPLWDVSNDLRGWSSLPHLLDQLQVPKGLPVIGSRYQTAAQAAFAVGTYRPFSLEPASAAERLEWPRLDAHLLDRGVSRWPALISPVLYVLDARYSQRPKFDGAECLIAGTINERRLGFSGKAIELWRCDPSPNSTQR